MKRKRAILRHFEPRIRPGRENFEIVQWGSAASQEARFAVLVENVNLSGKRLLDLGCGLGDLLSHLTAHRIAADYTGVDISAKMIDEARRRQPGGRFICADLFDDPANLPRYGFGQKSFDVAFCSGAFNLDLGNNAEFVPAAVKRLMELAGEHVVFNLLHTRTPRASDDGFVYYDPADVVAAIRPLGWHIRLLEDYLPNDFTIVCRNPSALAQTA